MWKDAIVEILAHHLSLIQSKNSNVFQDQQSTAESKVAKDVTWDSPVQNSVRKVGIHMAYCVIYMAWSFE